jgi:Zn-dependent protease/cell wall assembly regulator SMI1
MTDLLALIGAIVLIVKVLQYRALLSYPFARQRFAALESPPDEARDPLFAPLQAQAAELGFGEARWMAVARADGERELWPVRAVHRAPDGTGLLWVLPAGNIAFPHRLLVWFSHRLADGRTAITQPFDCYYEMVQGPALVARSTGLPELAGQWQAHRAWVDGLGSEPVAIPDHDLVADTEAFHERVRQDLIARGDARVLTADLAVARLGMAHRMRKAMAAMPKPPEDKRPVPASRIAHFAGLMEAIRQRSPPRDVQWTLFAISVVLFMGLGALLWDAAMAVYVLVVVLVHELGHFLAMRAFGYRNTHILALPLVGGVAMGHDVDPSATKRAWMSLMGPLPGIVIGWTLAVLQVTGVLTQPWVLPLATVFLLVNYLNVLPVPPLDGAHVLESLLPVRWARLQTLLIGLLAIAGALLALAFQLYVLAIIAALQLPALWGKWRLHGVERRLVKEASIGLRPREERIGRIARALDETLGPAGNAKDRAQQSLDVLHRLDTRPMGMLARAGTSLVYAALLAVPVAGVVVMGALSSSGWLLPSLAGGEPSEDDTRAVAAIEAKHEAIRAQAAALPLPALLAAVASDPLPPPASAEAIAAAEARLGQPLPADLRAIYAIADGVPGADIAPVAKIAPPSKETMAMLGYDEGKFYLDFADEPLTIEASATAGWWQIGGDEEGPLFYLPTPHPDLPGKRVVSAWMEAPSTHAGVRDFLDMRWVEARESEAMEARMAAATARASAKLAGAPIEQLLDSWSEPGFVMRWLNPDLAAADPADEATLRAAQARLGVALPGELATVLRRHDGFRPLQLLPAAEIRPWGEFTANADADTRKTWFDRTYAGNAPFAAGTPIAFDEAAIAHCLVVAGMSGKLEHQPTYPALLWCPDGRPAHWIEPVQALRHDSLHAWILPRAAYMHTSEEMQAP